ncbi:MAG: DHH family phosphoesterase [Deltaproteobacteria bacterium]|nr:DHH family phosphoesterase [Deltaproteobacteria bacterium]
MYDDLIRAMETAVIELDQWPSKTVFIFHHNDSDGLSSGAILKKAFERKGYKIERYALEKPYPALLRKIYEKQGEIIVFADFAGRIAPLLSDLNRGRNLTLILDHHVAEPATDPKVFNLDPTLFGLKGDRDMTGSTTCYLFARIMNSQNSDLAPVAGIGAVGDKFFVDGRLVTQNREVVKEAVDQGMMEIREQEVGERYFIKSSGKMMPCDELGDYLDVLGGAGYYRNGTDMGVKVCLEGVSVESDQMVETFKAGQEKIFADEIRQIELNGMIQTPGIQWVDVKDRFTPMGVKMIGIFCEILVEKKLIDPDKYVAGFQTIPNHIPGFGSVEFNETKISMRVSPAMEKKIMDGKMPGLNTFLPEATGILGGFSDACHTLCGATTIAIGRQAQLIEEMQKILDRT